MTPYLEIWPALLSPVDKGQEVSRAQSFRSKSISRMWMKPIHMGAQSRSSWLMPGYLSSQETGDLLVRAGDTGAIGLSVRAHVFNEIRGADLGQVGGAVSESSHELERREDHTATPVRSLCVRSLCRFGWFYGIVMRRSASRNPMERSRADDALTLSDATGRVRILPGWPPSTSNVRRRATRRKMGTTRTRLVGG